MDSILDSVKKMIGVHIDYNEFDIDLIMHINSTFVTLYQLGVGPKDKAFFIEDNTSTWSDFFGDLEIDNTVKTYMYKKIRMAFDPPLSSVACDIIQKQIAEDEWRMRENVEVFNNES